MELFLILLSLGTQQPFPRALDLIESLAYRDMDIMVQHGSTPPRPDIPNTTWVEFMPFEALVDAMVQADSVVCHAGVGTIMTALQAGHTPVVIPRQAQHGEHVDDHQLDIAMHFAERGLVRRVTCERDLGPLLTPRREADDQRIGKGSVELRATVYNAVDARTHRRLGFRLGTYLLFKTLRPGCIGDESWRTEAPSNATRNPAALGAAANQDTRQVRRS